MTEASLKTYWILTPLSSDGACWNSVLARPALTEVALPEMLTALFPPHLPLTLDGAAREDSVTPRPACHPDNARHRLLRLLDLVTNEASDNHAIETAIGIDPLLSVSLLRLVNSVSMGLARKIASFHQAIVILGRRQLRRWLMLLIYAQSGEGGGLLLSLAARRGHLLADLTRILAPADHNLQDSAFMTGILSLADQALGLPLATVLNSLSLDDHVSLALREHRGTLGRLVALVEHLDDGPPDQAAQAFAALGVDPQTAARLQAEAIVWADGATREA
ncbi:HDOD domain-containing protein [Denitratisoma oestradiolicum]|uniref:Uncharacterized protein n=1 Tax=Denitratisoma oestradiolicum TaxID=311182 RepID=A0A6S6Y488_9PROT|nr:HDOD domain-containing protein [Denitratisoma oestradiolicum]TWO80828.1 hypothetical protein CBW56_06615 [Denitratisoma oestradiolicum]CAB1367428.1 protein of unknown function [Denitratisoma oestradiolicum]